MPAYRLAMVGYSFMRMWSTAQEVLEILRKRGCAIEFLNVPAEISQEELARALAGFDFIIASAKPYYGRDFFRLNSDVCLIARHGIGYDNVDVDAAAEYGVYVIRVPNTIERNSVAEHAVALMLALLRRLPRADRIVRAGRFGAIRNTYELFDELSAPKDLADMVVGLVGIGNIGSRVAEILVRGFGARVIAYDPYVDPERARALGVELVKSLGELFERSDIVSIHAPLTPETRHMINREVLSRAKKGLILVNTSRGEIVDTEALLWALREGIISYAGLDVFEEEPLPKDHPLISTDNTILTPHIAAFVKTTQRRMLESIVRAIANYIEGRPVEEHAVVVVRPANPRRPRALRG